MVKSPATAATMAYPTEEERRSHPRISGIKGDDNGNGDDDDDDDDDDDRGNGKRDAFSRHARNMTSDSDDDFMTGDINENDKDDIISNDDFTCSYMPFLNKIINVASTADNPTSNQTLPYESSQTIGSQVRNWSGNKRLKRENKENHSLVMRGRRSRKQSRPMRLIWNQEPMGNGKTRTIPSLGRLEDITQNISSRVTQDIAEEISPDISQQQQNIAQDVSRDIAQDVAEDISRQQENDNVQNIAQDVSRDISQDVAEDISPGTSRQQENNNVQNITQNVSRDISQDVAEDISPGTSQQQQNNKMENARDIFRSLSEISKNITISDATRDNPLPNVRILNESVRKIRQRYQQRQKKFFKCILCWKKKRSFSRFFERRALILHKLMYH